MPCTCIIFERLVILMLLLTDYFNFILAIDIVYATTVSLSALDTTAPKGGSASFVCGYAGHETVTWKINEYYYASMRRPSKHTRIRTAESEIMEVRDVDLAMNGSTYQYIAESMWSTVVHLYVLPGL